MTDKESQGKPTYADCAICAANELTKEALHRLAERPIEKMATDEMAALASTLAHAMFIGEKAEMWRAGMEPKYGGR